MGLFYSWLHVASRPSQWWAGITPLICLHLWWTNMWVKVFYPWHQMLACWIVHSQVACCRPPLEVIEISKKENSCIKQRGCITIEDTYILWHSYLLVMMSLWRHSCSFSTIPGNAEAASPCHLIPFKPFCSLSLVNHSSLRVGHSSSGTPQRSANFFHFWHRTSPMISMLSAIAFEIQRSSISEISGCWVWWNLLAEWDKLVLVSYCTCCLDSFLSHTDMRGCVNLRLG